MRIIIATILLALAIVFGSCKSNQSDPKWIYLAGSTNNQDRGMIHLEHTSTGVSVPGLYVVNRSNKPGDGGVGIKIWNVKNSDAVYIKTDGKSSTGLAIDVVGGIGIQMKIWRGETAIWIYDDVGRGLMRLDSDGTLHLRKGKIIKHDL